MFLLLALAGVDFRFPALAETSMTAVLIGRTDAINTLLSSEYVCLHRVFFVRACRKTREAFLRLPDGSESRLYSRQIVPLALCSTKTATSSSYHWVEESSPLHSLRKEMQGQRSVDPLVSEQTRRALFVPRATKCGSNAGFLPPSVYMGFCLFVLPKTRY